jgi:diguanylate cyclase
MTHPDPAPAVDPVTLRQRAADLHERSRLGGVFYVLSWGLIAYFSEGWDRYPVACAALGAVFFVLMVMRFVLRARYLRAPETAAASMRRQWTVLLLTAIVWGGASAWALRDPAFADALPVTRLATVSLAMAFAQIFAVDRRMALLGTAAVFLPMLVIAWFGETPGIGMVLLLNALYLIAVIGRSHREYEARLALDAELRLQRDRFAVQSRTDALTGLANRGRFQGALADAVIEASATGMPLSLLIADLDHFKAINDRYGHTAGDRVLVAAAKHLAAAFPDARAVARIGGEEFAVVGAGLDRTEFVRRAEALRMRLTGTGIEIGQLAPAGVTISLGLAVYDPFEHDGPDALYAAADEALYRAKAGGRNRLETA